jgi:hypothetical protein
MKFDRKDVVTTTYTNSTILAEVQMVHYPSGIHVSGKCKTFADREALMEELKKKVECL